MIILRRKKFADAISIAGAAKDTQDNLIDDSSMVSQKMDNVINQEASKINLSSIDSTYDASGASDAY